MGVAEAFSLIAVLLLSLYGAASLLIGLSLRLLRPRGEKVKLYIELETLRSDVEWQVRYALSLSARWRLPLVIRAQEIDEETKRIVDTLLKDRNVQRLP